MGEFKNFLPRISIPQQLPFLKTLPSRDSHSNDLSECFLPEKPQFFLLNLGHRNDPFKCKSFEFDNKYVPADISTGLSLFHLPKGFKNIFETQNTAGQTFQKKALNDLFSLLFLMYFMSGQLLVPEENEHEKQGHNTCEQMSIKFLSSRLKTGFVE